MKVGLFLQDKTINEETAEKEFYNALKLAKDGKVDLFVFPEHAWTPFDNELNDLPLLNYEGEENKADEILKIVTDIAKTANCAVILCRADDNGAIYSYYANPFAKDGETTDKYYIKHVATSMSAFDVQDYEDEIKYLFDPIIFKGFKIGQTICYDSTFPLFSRMYGLNNVDLIINSTGGHVDYKKWSYYQKARALENSCNVLCTMAYFEEGARNQSYVFGYDSNGKKLEYSTLGSRRCKNSSIKNALYVFEINERTIEHEFDIYGSEIDEYLEQEENINKKIDFYVSPNELLQKMKTIKRIKENLFLLPQKDLNIVICYIKENDILSPEVVSNLLYDESLSAIINKRYIIFNDWQIVEHNYYERVLSNILKVRAAENFCAVIFNSENIKKCFQVGNNKNTQIVKMCGGKFGIDLARTTGPEAIWKNKSQIGMRGDWRQNYEAILKYINENAEHPISEKESNRQQDGNSTCVEKEEVEKPDYEEINGTSFYDRNNQNLDCFESEYDKTILAALCGDSTGTFGIDEISNKEQTTVNEVKMNKNDNDEIENIIYKESNKNSQTTDDERLCIICNLFYMLSESDKNHLLHQAELLHNQAKLTGMEPEIELLEHKLGFDEGTAYLGVTGRIRNNSKTKTNTAKVNVVFYDKNGDQVWEDGAIGSIRPGRTWKFRIDALDYEVVSYDLELE